MPRRAFGQLLTTLGSSGATQDRLWGSIWASKSRPEHVRTRPRNGFGRPRRPKMDFWAIWGPPGEDCCRFPNAFSSIFFKPFATKRQNRNLKKESCDPHQPTWLLRCAVDPCCSHVFRNDRRTLHVQPFVIAYPQAHLVQKKIGKSMVLASQTLSKTKPKSFENRWSQKRAIFR